MNTVFFRFMALRAHPLSAVGGFGPARRSAALTSVLLLALLGGAVTGRGDTYSFSRIAGSPTAYGTVDGTGAAARFGYNLIGLATDSAGNTYVADYASSTIRKVTAAGVVSTFAGLAGAQGTNDGTGAAARFQSPSGIALDRQGNVYVADGWGRRVRKITPAGVVTTLAGPGPWNYVDGQGANGSLGDQRQRPHELAGSPAAV